MKRVWIMAVLAASVMAAAGTRGLRGDDAGMYQVAGSEVITDFANDVPTDERNVSITVVMPEAMKAKVGLSFVLHLRDGKWKVAEPLPPSTQPVKPEDHVVHPAGVVGLFAPLQTGFGPPAPPQKGEVLPKEITYSKDGGLKGTVTVHLFGLEWPKGSKAAKRVYEDQTFDVAVDLKPTGRNVAATDPDPSTPSWRKNNTRATGRELRGTFTCKSASGNTVEGEATAGVIMAPVKGLFGAAGNAVISKDAAGGLRLDANLGTKRIAGVAAYATAIKEFDKPVDYSKFDGLRVTLSSPARRDDVTVSVGLQEKKGAWYEAGNAGFLIGKEASFIVPFADLKAAGGFDDDSWLDLDAVKAIRIGIGNPMGVGEVAVTIRKIEAVRWTEAGAGKAPTEAVTITVDPTTAVSHEGAMEVPKGLFGFHDVSAPMKPKTPEDEPKIIDYTRQVNPGFLRRIEHTGFGGKLSTPEDLKARVAARLKAAKDKPESFDHRRLVAGNAADAVMQAHTTNLWAAPPWMGPYAKGDMEGWLTGVEAFYQNIGAGSAWIKGDDANPVRLLEIWNEPFMWARHMNKHDPKFQDPTQFSDAPGKLITDVYSSIFKAAVKGVRAANPDVQIGGPCSAGFPEDHFVNLKQFVFPFIDQCHDQIDLITEHHYQGEPAAFAASYEVLTAYADTKYAKRFPIYNTEANDLVDTPNKGEKKEDQPFDEKADEMNRAYYNAKDILTMIREVPDVAKGRAMHALWTGFCRNQGETDVYTLMNNLRGTVLAASSSEPGMITVATENHGTLVVLAMNDTPFERKIRVQGIKGTGTLQTLTNDGGTKLASQPVSVSGTAEVTLPKRAIAKWTLTGAMPPAKLQDHRRFFSPAVFQRVTPGTPLKTTIKLSAAQLQTASAAMLRVVTGDVQRGEGVVTIGGKKIALPMSVANDGAAVIQEIPLDPKLLQEETTLEFGVAKPEIHNGYELDSAAIVLVETR